MGRKYGRALARGIGRRIRGARDCRRLDLETLARKAGLDAARLRHYEAGQGQVTIDELERLAAALHLPVLHFLEQCVLCGHDLEPPPARER